MKLTSQRAFFYEIGEDREIALARSRGVPLPVWEDLEEQKPKSDGVASISANPTRPSG